MKAIGSFLLALVASLVSAQPTPVSNATREIVFVNVNIIPMDEERVLERQTVVTRNGRITAIGRQAKYGSDALVVDAAGQYLMPGLAEMHAHVPPIDNLEPIKDVVALFALNGITTIRGMLGHPRHLELREMINKGELVSPHFHTTGPSLNGMSVTSPEAGAEMVRKQKEAGYDFLKLHPGLTRQKFDAIAIEAKRVGIPFVGHVSFGVGVWRAIEAGYSSIDHLDGFIEGMVPGIEQIGEQNAGFFGSMVADQADTTQIPKLMKALKSNGIWVVPTQSLAERWISPEFTPADFEREPEKKYMKPETVQQWIKVKSNMLANPDYDAARINRFISLRRRLVRACRDYGVGLLLGCDAPQVFNVPGFSTHNELTYLVDAGLTPFEALRTGTVNVARYFNRDDAGVIREGAVSDLILLSGNPLADIRQSRNIVGVMIGDKWLDSAYREAELKRLTKF